MNQDSSGYSSFADELRAKHGIPADVPTKKKRKRGPEEIIQRQCVAWFRQQYPKLILFHVPNGGHRSKAEAGIFKALGVLPGVPDLFLAQPRGPYAGLFVEMKSEKGTRTPEQKEMHARLKQAGYCVETENSLDSFMRLVRWYLNEA